MVAGAAAGITQSAAAEDLDTVRTRAQEVAEEITTLGEKLESLEQERARAAREIESIDGEVARLELEIAEAEDVYQEQVERLEVRAVEAYKAGSHAGLTALLSADSLNEMETISKALGEAADVDQAIIDDVLSARAASEEVQDDLDDKKQRLMAAFARKDALADEVAGTIAERDEVLEELNDHIAELEREELIAARESADDAVDVTAGDLPDYKGDAPPTVWGSHDPHRLDGTGPAAGIPTGFESIGVAFEGEASWYGPGFEGNTTANGDVFDSRLYTVASKTLPFGTYLYVTYQGRGVVVYVNDRGPYAGDRILDLSHAAASAIGISGVGWVRAEIIVKTR